MDRGAWWARVHGVRKELDRTDWLTHTRSKSWHVSWDLKDNLNFIAAKKDEVHLGTLRGQLERSLVNLGCACILQTELNRMWQTPGRCYCIWFFFFNSASLLPDTQNPSPLPCKLQFPWYGEHSFRSLLRESTLGMRNHRLCPSSVALHWFSVPGMFLEQPACRCQNIPPAEIYLKPSHYSAQGRRQKHFLPAFPLRLIMQNHTWYWRSTFLNGARSAPRHYLTTSLTQGPLSPNPRSGFYKYMTLFNQHKKIE